MARKIKFTLEMKNGIQARTLEDLKDNFDLEKAVGYFTDGRLLTWLEERYYEDEAEAIKNISAESDDFHKQLCNSLGVELNESEVGDISVEEIEKRKKRLEHLRQFTADENILKDIDKVAFDQEELGELLDNESNSLIILCNNTFRIPLKKKNKTYIGVGKVEAVIKSKEKINWSSLGIKFRNIKFDSAYEKYENQTGEQLFRIAMQEEDDEKKFMMLKDAADSGSGEALCELGRRYQKGIGVEKDYDSARNFFSRAIELGNARAMDLMGDMYYDGTGVEKDLMKACEYYRMSAENDDAGGMLDLGASLFLGDGVKKNSVEAIKWLEKSMEFGIDVPDLSMIWLGHIYSDESFDGYSAETAFNWYKKAAECNCASGRFVAQCYSNGKGCTKDLDKAIYWYKKAADNNDDEAMNDLGLIYGDIADRSHTYSESKEARKSEISWYNKAADNGNIAAISNLGYCYHHGIGVNKWLGKAVELYRKAAKKGSVYAMVGISNIYLYEKDSCNINCQEVRKWLDKAAELDSGEAMNNLAYMYETGNGVPKNYSVAVDWYKKAIDADYDYALVNLGLMYEEGQGVAQNYVEAGRLYKIASDKGIASGMRLIGRLYFNGNGVSKDVNKALEWWQRAMDSGDIIARRWITEFNEERNNGNTNKDSSCFITTAVCGSYGKADNCYELTTFRDFRDNWLLKQTDGKTLIEEYYRVAPEIVDCINKQDNAKVIYMDIWEEYLKPCLWYIENNNNLMCKNKYIEMVRDLKRKYLNCN